MITKKTAKKEEKEEKKVAPKAVAYFYAIGKRKTAVAQVRLYPTDGTEKGILVNDRKIEEYFPLPRLRELIKSPLLTAGSGVKFDITAKVNGGGVNAQAEAIRLGISRALVKFNGELKKSLRDRGFLTRDARKVERKKPGLKKARKSPQWAKR